MRTSIANIAIAAAVGAAIWAVSPVFTGYAEPWDAESSYYVVSLMLSGALLGFVRPMKLWCYPVGLVLGQLLYQAIFLSFGPLLLVGMTLMAAYALLSFAAAFVGSSIRSRFDVVRNGVRDDEQVL